MKEKYLYPLLVFLLNIALISLSSTNSLRDIYSYQSEIHLVIKGSGNQELLNNIFKQFPSEVLVNGVKDNSCNKTCHLNGDINYITLIYEEKITTCESMFCGLNNIIEIDLSNFDTSEVTSMYRMFKECSDLEKINFGNINTSSVTNMRTMFFKCPKIIKIDLSKFDTSKVATMYNMFLGCSELRYLDLSNFTISKETNITGMFQYLNFLKYLNIYNLKISEESINMNEMLYKIKSFSKISSNTKICIKNYSNLDCSDTCFEKNIKLEYNNNYKCLKSCDKYEYNNICYEKCPEDTYILYSDNNYDKNDSECLYRTPSGYYLDKNNKTFKACYKSCKFCYGQGNETNNNCKYCNANYTFLNDSKYNTNCYKKCDHFYYFNDSYDYNCVETCQGKYNKSIIDKKICIDDCKKDNIYNINMNIIILVIKNVLMKHIIKKKIIFV